MSVRDSLTRIIDWTAYGPQLLNRSVGRVNQGWVLLSAPSPGQANGAAAGLDNGDRLRLNEWLAGGGGTNDFVELYNPALLPVDLSGWTLTDDPSISGSTNNRVAPLTFIDGRGFLQFHADGEPGGGLDHTKFRIDQLGETIRLLNPAQVVVDTVDLLVQTEAVSEGRLPDGLNSIVRFGQPTPGAPNQLSSPDADHDGMDDDWERLDGLDPASATDADRDPDNDGASNLQEFLAGTDPHNPSSLLRLAIAGVGPGGLKLGFIGQPGRAYTIEYSDELVPPVWRMLTQVPAGTQVSDIVVGDPTPSDQRPTRFYRLTAAQH